MKYSFGFGDTEIDELDYLEYSNNRGYWDRDFYSNNSWNPSERDWKYIINRKGSVVKKVTNWRGDYGLYKSASSDLLRWSVYKNPIHHFKWRCNYFFKYIKYTSIKIKLHEKTDYCAVLSL